MSESGGLRKLPELIFNGATILVGTPADAIEDPQRYRSQARMTHVLMSRHLPGLDNRKTRHSMELFAKQVMPHFRD